jgi:DNA mismatch repair ATPase MutS
LADQFKNNLLEKQAIIDQQDAIKIYSTQMSLVASVIATGLLYKTEYVSFDALFDWLNTPNHLHQSNWAKIVRYALPVLNIILIILVFVSGNNSLLGIAFVLGWSQIVFYAKYFQADFNLLGKKENILKQYAHILDQFAKIDIGNSEILKSYQLTAKQAHVAIEDLSKISSRIDQRLNLFLITIVNPILLYDIQNMFALESWKMKHKNNLPKWIQLVGKIEKMNSYAFYAFNNATNTYPTILEKEKQIIATDLSHPLIAKEKSVPNDLNIGKSNKLLLITGSNMSGKTTFLRTVGVNLILAQIGLPVSASTFSFSPMQIFSSIRISDSLQESTSYFMAELKKLSAIKIGVQHSECSLVLIDEILRGTNSDDKYFGSAQFVKEMIALNCLTLFATHDLKLSELETEFPDKVSNFCFESVIENDELIFGYKIQRGVAKNRNASFLMKKMGII